MKTLRNKILLPMVLLIVLVPAATLLFFNIAMRIYVRQAAASDLNAAILPVETTARQELGEDPGPLTGPRLEFAAVRLTKALQSGKLVGGRLLIYSGNAQLAYPKTLPDGFVTPALALKVAQLLRASNFAGRVYTLRVRKTQFLMCGFSVSGGQGGRLLVVLVTQLEAQNRLIRTVNVVLLVIMLTGILVGVWVAVRLARRMAAGVGQFCEVTEQIGSGDFTLPRWEKTDISEFNQLSQSIERMAGRLRAAERSQRDFLQNASHELRTPLMSIQGYAEGIAGGIVPDAKEAADIIGSESRRIGALVEELLTLSRIESRTLERRLAPLDLRELLPEYVQRLGGIAMQRRKTIALELPPEPVTVAADEELLGQAVQNVVGNCLRYARARVHVALLREAGAARILIEDDGPGIPEADLPHLFERFYKGKGGNFGLGLAIARSAVEYLGGRIGAANRPASAGAVFDIVLPLEK